MGNRLKKALQALGLVLVITLACLAFMPWRMGDVIQDVGSANRCMVLRYDQNYSIAYPQAEQLEEVKGALADATGTFDRNREGLVYWGEEPMYRIYLWTDDGRISDIWLCGPAIYYDGSQYALGDASASKLNDALTECFSNK